MCVCVCVLCAWGERRGERRRGKGGKRGSVKTVSRGLEYQLLVSART